MPIPVSITWKLSQSRDTTLFWSPPTRRPVVTRTVMAPRSVNFTAFDNRLSKICLSLFSSVCKLGLDLHPQLEPLIRDQRRDRAAHTCNQVAYLELDAG